MVRALHRSGQRAKTARSREGGCVDRQPEATPNDMEKTNALPSWQEEHDRAQGQPGAVRLDQRRLYRTAVRGAGPACQWTRKAKGKTAKVALSEEQYEWLNAAIANWRTVQTTLRQMQRLSRRVLLTTTPDIERRQPLSKKARGASRSAIRV